MFASTLKYSIGSGPPPTKRRKIAEATDADSINSSKPKDVPEIIDVNDEDQQSKQAKTADITEFFGPHPQSSKFGDAGVV